MSTHYVKYVKYVESKKKHVRGNSGGYSSSTSLASKRLARSGSSRSLVLQQTLHPRQEGLVILCFDLTARVCAAVQRFGQHLNWSNFTIFGIIGWLIIREGSGIEYHFKDILYRVSNV